MYENQHFENQFDFFFPTWHHFGGKTNWFGPKKKNFNESSWFEELKCKLGLKVVHFFLFWFSFTLVAQTL
jgi:hypothetical protein